MTDRFNKKAQDILRRGDENGGLTNRNLFDLQIAAHEESMAVSNLLHQRIDEQYAEIDLKFEALECIKNPRHPRRSYDEPDTDYRGAREDRRLWVLWNVAVAAVKDLALPVSVAVIATLALTRIF